MKQNKGRKEATVWKEATLSFSHTVNPWDSIWTGKMEDGSLPTYVITEEVRPEFSHCTLVLLTGKDKKKNTLHLLSLHETYQHLPPWDGTIGHAVFLLAELLRYKDIYDPGHILTSGSIPIKYTPPRPLILLTEYEKESYRKNSVNPLIDKILLLPPNPTFSDIFSLCSSLPLSYVVFTRKGIVLDDWKTLWSISMEKRLLTLSPYDTPISGNLEDDLPPSSVQGCWVIRSEDVPSTPFPLPIEDTSEIEFASFILKERLLLENLSLSLKAWRPPSSAKDTSHHKEDLFMPPSGINEFTPIFSLESPLLVSNCFQTDKGLAFDSSSLYIGSGRGAEEAWSEEFLLPTVSYPIGTIVPIIRENIIVFTIAKLLLKSQGVYTCPEEYLSLYRRFGLNNTIPYTTDHIHYTSALVHTYDKQVHPEMIDVLRKTVGWSSEIDYTDRPTLICEDATFEEVLRPAWNIRVIECTEPFDRILANLSGAWGIIGTSLLQYSWILPLGARVFDLSSLPINAQQAEVAGLRYIPTTKEEFLTTLHDTD